MQFVFDNLCFFDSFMVVCKAYIGRDEILLLHAHWQSWTVTAPTAEGNRFGGEQAEVVGVQDHMAVCELKT